jgi:hypothetical protein
MVVAVKGYEFLKSITSTYWKIAPVYRGASLHIYDQRFLTAGTLRGYGWMPIRL